jgi:hypothetical protein
MIDYADSILWKRRYNDIGEAEIYIGCTTEYVSWLKKGHYLYRSNDDILCKIESAEITTSVEEGDYVIATAFDFSKVFSGRVVVNPFAFSGKVCDFVERLLIENVIGESIGKRRVPNFRIDKSNFAELTAEIDISVANDDVGMLIINTCKAANYGFKTVYDVEKGLFTFSLYNGKNKASAKGDEYIEFSPAFANIITSSYNEDESLYKNVVYISYKDESENVQTLVMFRDGVEPEAEDRREMHLDATGQSREVTEGETKRKLTNDEFMDVLHTLGEQAFIENDKTQSFRGDVDTIDSYLYKVDYDLGDIVNAIDDYGNQGEARIIEITESEDADNRYQVEPKFEFVN